MYTLLILTLVGILSFERVSSITKLGEMEAVNAGFSRIYEHPNPQNPRERYSLILASFNPVPFTEDFLFFFRHVGKYLSDVSSAERLTLTNDLTWPREPRQVPGDVFGFEAICQPDGFLVPFKDEGSVKIVDLRDFDNPVVTDIATRPDDKNWFYHRAIFKDIDKDGIKDIFINRGRVDNVAGEREFQMVWYKNPSSSTVSPGPWELNILKQNMSDTMSFEATLTVNGEEFDTIFTVGYFTQQLVVHWTTDPSGRWDNPDMISSRVIGTLGQYFDVEIVDLNNDGRLDILTTLNSPTNGSFIAYEIPDDFRTGEYVLHFLATNFVPRSGVGVAGSPGQGNTFYPTEDTSGKPYIVLSGDDDGRAYYLTSQAPNDPNNWNYNLIEIIDEGPENIIGRPSVVDADGDGFKEVFIPSFFAGKVHVYTFAEQD